MRICFAQSLQGCGFVSMSTHEEANAALQALDGHALFGKGHPAFVVKWTNRKPSESISAGGISYSCTSGGVACKPVATTVLGLAVASTGMMKLSPSATP